MTCEAENQVQDDRILDLETDANINGQILQNHSSALADLKGEISFVSFLFCLFCFYYACLILIPFILFLLC